MFLASTNFVLLVGLFLMALFAIFFLCSRKQNKDFINAFLITSVTALSYLIMYEGSFNRVTAGDQVVYYTRWFFYAFSCSLLMLTIAKHLKTLKENILPVVIMNVLVMMTGGIAAVLHYPMKWWVLAMGIVFFAIQLFLLFERTKCTKISKMIQYYILLGWCFFPVIFIFSAEGLGWLDDFYAAMFYLILDLITKVLFYINLTTISAKK